jgi:hypothetical protein
VTLDAIPGELRDLPRWIVWRWGEVDPKTGRRKKPPYPADRPDGPRHASNKNPGDWTSFEKAVAVVDAGRADGIGFALTPPFVGVDLDDELPDSDQGVIMVALDSYSEKSVSGTGYHVILRADLNGRGRHPEGIGVFQIDRFFYFTGEHVTGTPTTIEPRQEQLEEVLQRFLPQQPATPADPVPAVARPVDLGDHELLEKAFQAKNGDRFRALWNGDTSAYGGDESRADQAFLNMLAFWTSKDAGRMDALFRSSGLYRQKWEREDYRERSIEKAIADTTEVYEASARNFLSPSEEVEEVEEVELGSGGFSVELPSSSALKEEEGTTKNNPGGNRARGTSSDGRGSSPSEPQPFALPIAEFVAVARPPREPLLADEDGRAIVGRHSLILLGALGGHGKTTFFVDLALHLAAGVDYPPFTVPAPVSVLLIENEGPEELFAEKLKARLASFPHELKARLDVCVFDWGAFSLADVEARERLTAEIAEKGYDLVFGDPLDSLGIEGVGSPEDTRLFMALMKATGLNKTVAWWLNTHPRKEETKEALNEIAGAWGGKPDSVLLLRMLEDDRTQVRFPKLRWTKRGTRPPILLAFDADTEAFTFLGEQSEEKRDYLREVFAFLQTTPWQTATAIAAPARSGGIGANDATVKKQLDEHPDIFESRTGEEAVALGRKANATLWGLRPDAAEKLAAGGTSEP